MKVLLRKYVCAAVVLQFLWAGIVHLFCRVLTLVFGHIFGEAEHPAITVFALSFGPWAYLVPVCFLMIMLLVSRTSSPESHLVHVLAAQALVTCAVSSVLLFGVTYPLMIADWKLGR